MITKISKGYKITIPSSLRKKYNIEENDNIEWTINEKGNIKLKPNKKESILDLVGIISDPEWDCLKATEKANKGEKL